MSWTSEPLDDVAHHAGSLPVALTHLDIICRASICTAASTEDNPPEQSDSGMTYCPTWPYLALPGPTCCTCCNPDSWSKAGPGR